MPASKPGGGRLGFDHKHGQLLSFKHDGLLIDWCSSGGSISVRTVAVDIMYALPLYLPNTMLVGAIYAEIPTTGAAGNMRMNLYTDLNGYPNQRLVAETEITTMATVGVKRQLIGLTLPYGFYWGASVFSSTPEMRGENFTSGQNAHWLGATSATDVVSHPGISVAFTYAAMPATFTAGGTLISDELPRIIMAVQMDADDA